MELTLRVKGFVPGFALQVGGFAMEFAWPFVQVGRWSFWIERTGHKPEGGKLLEVWRDEADAGSVHVFALGRRLIVSRERRLS